MALRGNRKQQLLDVRNKFAGDPPILQHVAVETGTWKGDTTAAMGEIFREVYTVDLSDNCYRNAVDRFSGTNIRCLYGESGDVVKVLAGAILEPVFWFLDAHLPFAWPKSLRQNIPTSHPMPLFRELECIMSRQFRDIIIVDDVHSFGHKNGWSDVTIENLMQIVRPVAHFKMRDAFAMVREP